MMTNEQRTWPRYVTLVLAGVVLMDALATWFGFYLNYVMQPIVRTPPLIDFVVPITVTAAGITTLILGFRAKQFGVSRFALIIVAVVCVYAGSYGLKYWDYHRHDYGDPNDDTKPWRYGGDESHPGYGDNSLPPFDQN